MFALAAASLLALAGCGGGGSKGQPIPRAQADRLIGLIGLADQESQNGTCGGARAKVREAQGAASQLPTSVDKDVRQGIADGLGRLLDLINSECQPPTKSQTQTTQTQTQSQTTSTPTTTSQTQTTPTQSSTATTPTTTSTGTTTTPTTPTDTTTGNGGTPTTTGAGIVPPADGTTY